MTLSIKAQQKNKSQKIYTLIRVDDIYHITQFKNQMENLSTCMKLKVFHLVKMPLT